MKSTRYWFSAKQKRMRDSLGGAVTKVFIGGVWAEYTESTVDEHTPTVWGDYTLVAEGVDLPTSSAAASPLFY